MDQPNHKFTNAELASVFELIGDLLEIKGENIYKILAYRKAADSLNNLGRDVNELWRTGELQSIPGVGKAIAEKIDEILSTGKLNFLENLENEVPASLVELLRVPDVGPKKAALFWRQAGITNLPQLEEAARTGKLRHLPGIGEKAEARILAGIEALQRRSNRIPLGKAYPLGMELRDAVRGIPNVAAAEIAGSLRRMRSTIGDVDLIVSTDHSEEVIRAILDLPYISKITAQGQTKISGELRNAVPFQIWLHPVAQFGSALQYGTGSKEHSVRLREIAQNHGLSLSDHGMLMPDGTLVSYATEAEVYSALGMPWIPPELREDRGEIQAALHNTLPVLIERSDVIAELHSHSTWSDGRLSIREMAETVRSRGYRVLAITDHSMSLGIAGGMDAEAVRRQRTEIDQVQKELGVSLRLLQGAEVEILADGNLDYPDDVLASLDVVIASLHTSLRQPRAVVTERLLRAIRNPNVDVIGHPTGRLIPDREGADLDMDAVLAAARESGVALEINAHPARLDLDDIYSRRAKELGIPLSLNTDAHSPADLDMILYGLATARRGWIEAKDVINTWPVDQLVTWLRSRGSPK